MKTVVVLFQFVYLFFLFNNFSFGQVQEDFSNAIFHAGNWELNFSASIGNLNTSSKSSSSGTYGSYSDDDSYSLFYIQLGVIPAYFFTDGLAFEPEINVLFQSQENVESKPSFSFLGNFAYNFNMPGKNFAPYVRAGYGISNSMQIPAVIGGLARVSDDLNVNILNAGVGLKFLVSPHLLLRTEINYRRYSYKVENSYPDFNSTYDYSLTSISGIFGFSVLL